MRSLTAMIENWSWRLKISSARNAAYERTEVKARWLPSDFSHKRSLCFQFIFKHPWLWSEISRGAKMSEVGLHSNHAICFKTSNTPFNWSRWTLIDIFRHGCERGEHGNPKLQKQWGKLLTRATCFQAANIFPQSPVQVIFLFSGWIVAQSMVRFTLCMEMDALISSMTKDRRAMTRFCHYLCWWARILSGSSSSPLVWLQFIRQLIWQLRHWNRRA